MRSILHYRLLFLILLACITGYRASATHIRAGEITARRISATSLTYQIKLTAYFDIVNGEGAAANQNSVNFVIGPADANPNDPNYKPDFRTAPRSIPFPNIGNNTTQNTYLVNYTFPSAGKFRISFEEDNRNNNILNIGPPPTRNLNFYVSTILEINASFGLNQTPVLLNAPIDLAAVGQRYIHNPNAFDADGDSLAYRLFVPQRGIANGAGQNLQYRDPNLVTPPGTTEAGASPATFSINRLTGDLIWNAPVTKGYYNVAFIVEEWRDGVLIGQIVRDMQIIVEDARNDRPLLAPIPDICIEAGTTVNQVIRATDKNGDRLNLTTTGGVYQASLVPPTLASFNVAQQGSVGAVTGQFIWQTSCAHIRQEPYDVLFKVEDAAATGNPPTFRKLVDITTLNIKVYGPAPVNLQAVPVTNPAGNAYSLTWNSYKCQIPGARIFIYRKEGCFDVPVDVCVTGVPAEWGYTEVASVPVGDVAFIDNNKGAGLKSGVSYSYRIAVKFPRPGAAPTEPGALIGGGESLSSAESCLNLPQILPLLTNVTVDSTSTTKGVITVKWIKPAVAQAGPAQYRLLRATGLNGTVFTEVARINVGANPDDIFVDRNLNTVANAYTYQLEYWHTENNTLVKLGVTEPASSVRLEQGAADPSLIRLNWTAIVPWTNTGQTHRVYREDKARPGTFNRIAEVRVQGNETFTYSDDGSDKYAADGVINETITVGPTYCYKVETVGSYNNSKITPSVLYNLSQIICVSTTDTTKPCPPVLVIDQLDCGTIKPEEFCDDVAFTNNLSWTYPADVAGKPCDPNVTSYKVYYARYEGDTPALIKEIKTPPLPLATSFAHEGLTSFAGCYYVTAVNRFGRESPPSNTVCKDNCPMYVLPNVFTPNGDGKNDIFQPYDCPSFVQSVQFKVFNRWGAKVFETKDVKINWNGKNSAGNELSAGQYYYEAVVLFESIQKNPKPTQIKGWVQILR
jgi:gliding motility-associated-like protein